MSVNSLSFSTDHPRHLMLFRRHISRRAAGNGRAVLEGVGLDAPTIAACFTAHPSNEEEVVQEGLTKWCGGKGVQPPTWRVLIEAIAFAEIAQQDIEALKKELSADLAFNEGTYNRSTCVRVLVVAVTLL